jgi:hypothetical protein
MVFPIQRRSTLQNGIGIQHPQPGPRENSDEAVKIGARRVLHHYQRYYVVPLRKEILIKHEAVKSNNRFTTQRFSTSHLVW